MQTSPIPANSTSYPTHAVIIHQGVTDGAERYAVWMLSWAIFKSMIADRLALVDREVEQRRGNLAKLVGTRREFDLFSHLQANHRRSVDILKAEAKLA